MASLSHEECALAVGLSHRKLRRLVERYGLPAVRRGRGCPIRYDLQAVQGWLADHDRRRHDDSKNREIARQIIATLADSAAVRFRAQSGPFKLELAVNVICGFFEAATTVRRNLGLPDLTDSDVPAEIRQIERLVRSSLGRT